MKCLAPIMAIAAIALAACGSKPQVHTAGTVSAPQTFAFKNFTQIVVDAPAAPFVWEEFNVRDGSALKPPYGELRVELRSGVVTATDRNCTNRELYVAGTRHAGTQFLLHADGRVEVTQP